MVIQTKNTYAEMSAEDYHANPAHGASMLEDFRASRKLFYDRYITKETPRKQATPAMEDGTLVHCLLFEPEKYEDLLAPMPPEFAPDGKKWLRRKASDHEKWWAEYLETTEGKIVADEKRRMKIEATVDAIHENDRANSLLSQDGCSEYSIFWIDDETGLECKCRVDYLAEISVDLKTTQDPSPQAYAKTIVNFGYHRKLAHYCAGLRSYHGIPGPLVHIAAGTQEPYLIANYDIDDRDERGDSLGERQRRNTLTSLAECYETGDWREPCEKQITKLRLPGWAWSSDDWTISGD